MPSIDLTSMERVVFNGKEVEILQLNGQTIWELATDDLRFNYVGLDASGNMEGQLAFDGTIVAYAIGKPVITITTADDGTQSETITYDACGAFNSEYYGGYNFQNLQSAGTDELVLDAQIIDTDIIIPNTYKSKPITEILQKAFASMYKRDVDYDEESAYPQACYIENITFGSNITTIGQDAFNGTGNKPIGFEYYHSNLIFKDKLERIEARAFSSSRYNIFDLPTSVLEVGYEAFDSESSNNKVIVKSNITPITYELVSAGIYDNVEYVIFESSVTDINGKVINVSSRNGNNWIFKHSANANITINITSLKSAVPINIYTDNNIVKNYDWASVNITPTFYPLSDYQG